MRRPLLLLVVPLLTVTAACTTLLGDFTLGAAPFDAGTDGGSGGDGGGEAAVAAMVNAVAPPVFVYIGQTATLDGSGSTTSAGRLSYSWIFQKGTGVPEGSQVTSDSISGATSATPFFTPDVLGVYTLVFTATALGVSSTISVKVTAILPSVFYAQGTASGDGGTGGTAVYTVADFDGGFEAGSTHPVVCPMPVTTDVPHEIATYAAFGGRAFDFWEAPAGKPSRFAGFLMDWTSSGGYTAELYTGTSASRCGADGGPVDIGTMDFGPRPYGSSPHFNPNGSRFVVYSSSSNIWGIVTYTFDGSPPTNHVYTYPVQYMTGGSTGLDPSGALSLGDGHYVQEPPRVEWTSTGLAWAVPMGVGTWAIMTAPDSDGATPTTFMTCAGVTPREIAMLSDGSVIASYRSSSTSGENLVHLKPDPNTMQCTTLTTYTSVGSVSGAIATDFAVSPDETQIAFLEVDPTAGQDAAAWTRSGNDAGTQLPGGYVYTVPVKGGTSPTQVSTTPAIYGPRWIGAGASLVFTALNGTTDAGAGTFGLATSVTVLQLDGGAQNVVATGDGVTTFVSTSGSGACSTAPGERGAPAAGALLSLAAVAELVRRRSRRR